MAYDLVPRRMWSFPTLSRIFEDDEDWANVPSAGSGLSVSEDEKNVYVEAALPGINPDDIEVTLQDGYVWVRGEAKEEEKDKNRKYYRQASRSFSYRVAVPGDIDHAKEPDATYENGVMKVTFAKSPEIQPKKIKVKQLKK